MRGLRLPRGRRFPPPPAQPSARSRLALLAPTPTSGATPSPTPASPLQPVVADSSSPGRLAPPSPTPPSSPTPTSLQQSLAREHDASWRGLLPPPAPSPTSVSLLHIATSPLRSKTSPLQSKVHRLFSTARSQLLLKPAPADLLSAPERYVTTNLFNIGVGLGINLQDEIDRDTVMIKKHHDESVLKGMFASAVEAALIRRGLLWDHPIITEETRNLHASYTSILGSPPMYLSIRSAMVHLVKLPRPYWRHFFDYLSHNRIIVLNDWNLELYSKLSITMYDHGVRYPRDDVLYYKGESDGSHKTSAKTGTVGMILWRGNKVVISEIYTEVPCESSVEAEAKAMFLQLKRGIQFKFLQPCTDNYAVYKLVKGELDSIKSVGAELCELLQGMRGQYEGFMPRWVPRKEISFIDGLLKDPELLMTLLPKLS